MKQIGIDLFNQTDNGAIFSDCRKYRYVLWRIWNKNKPLVMFIGLNPSTANELTDDPTIRRVKRFAFNWGFGGFYMMNLFAYVTSYPQELKKCYDPIMENYKWLKEIELKCVKTIFAWGSFKETNERAKDVMQMFIGYVLGINKNGSPKHPLYIRSDIEPIKYLE